MSQKLEICKSHIKFVIGPLHYNHIYMKAINKLHLDVKMYIILKYL